MARTERSPAGAASPDRVSERVFADSPDHIIAIPASGSPTGSRLARPLSRAREMAR